MKRVIFLCLFVCFLAAMPLIAQDFTQPKAQFLSFNFGVPIGISFVNDGEVVAGGNVGVDFTVIDNLVVGLNLVKGLNINMGGGSSVNYLGLQFSNSKFSQAPHLYL